MVGGIEFKATQPSWGLGLVDLGKKIFRPNWTLTGSYKLVGSLYMGRFPERQHFFAENDKIGILQSR